MLWWQAVSLITIVYSSKSSGKFLGSPYLCDIDFERHTREISPSIIFDMIWLINVPQVKFNPEQVLFFVLGSYIIVNVWIAKIQHIFRGWKIRSIGKNIMYSRNDCSIRGCSVKPLTIFNNACIGWGYMGGQDYNNLRFKTKCSVCSTLLHEMTVTCNPDCQV